MSYLEQVDKTRVPRHVAIIMDGNGRWATSQGMDRTMGHQAGAQKSHEIMETAVKLGLDYLTLYTFSTENWNRPLEEIAALMSLLLKHLEEELFMKYDARFTVVGDIQRLPENVQEAIRLPIKLYTPLYFILAMNYRQVSRQVLLTKQVL